MDTLMDCATFAASYTPVGRWPEGVLERFAHLYADAGEKRSPAGWAKEFARVAPKVTLSEETARKYQEWRSCRDAEEQERARKRAYRVAYNTPERQQARAERRTRLATEQEQAILLHLDGKSYQEIADVMGIPKDYVERRLYRFENAERYYRAQPADTVK